MYEICVQRVHILFWYIRPNPISRVYFVGFLFIRWKSGFTHIKSDKVIHNTYMYHTVVEWIEINPYHAFTWYISAGMLSKKRIPTWLKERSATKLQCLWSLKVWHVSVISYSLHIQRFILPPCMSRGESTEMDTMMHKK